MLIFAYDGSLNGDWVAHYGVRFAVHTAARALRLVHVREGLPEAHLEERLGRIADECKVLGVGLEVDLVARGGTDVAERLLQCVPRGATVIAGARARPRNRLLLGGTVSSRLLDAGRCSVVAIRVVHPGVLGQPGRVLLPLAGAPRAAAHALPLLRLLGGDLRHLQVLVVREVSRLRLRVQRSDGAERLLANRRGLVATIEEELRVGLAPHRFDLDSSVVLSDDAPREILLEAAKHRSRLICLGASRRTWRQRLVYGAPIERVLRDAPSDVAVYRSVE